MSPVAASSIAPKDQNRAIETLDNDKREKRSRACAHCRRAKVKCIREDNSVSCKRCQAQKIQCVYEFKVSSFKAVNADTSAIPSSPAPRTSHSLTRFIRPSTDMPNNANEWKSNVEDRLNNFDSKLGTILHLLERQSSGSNSPSPIPFKDGDQNHKRQIEYTSISDEENPAASKRPRLDSKSLEPELSDILNIDEAKILFEFFDKNVSPQLFGFDISHYSVDGIWETCPLLIATICCIASIHNPKFNRISKPLEALIYRISKEILLNTPKTEIEAFNTIVALCFCGFWFKKSQMFTGLALQLARTMNLVSPSKKSSVISKQDRLKLWYLLYILDGQQSLAFNRHPLVCKEDDMFAKSKELLLSNEPHTAKEHDNKIIDLEKSPANEESDNENVTYHSNYSNLRLVSQVEYHHALSSVLEGEAWDLLMPSSFGLPFQTNLELDKWMVQWTVLLSPFNNHPVWSSKSTLIYYNFAKMHINSCAVRKFQMDYNGVDELPKFDETIDFNVDNDVLPDESQKESNDDFNEDDSEDDDEESLDLNKELSPYQSGKVSSELALSAAETALNIVLNDEDVLNVIKYVPIHIHVMLYYAALLVLKPMKYLIKDGETSTFENSLKSIKLVKRLVDAIKSNSPTDREFSVKIINGLRELIKDKVNSLRNEIEGDQNKLKELEKALNTEDLMLRKRSPKISAWPGYDAGHPSKAQ